MVRNFDKYMKLVKIANGTFGTTGIGTERVSTTSFKFEVINEATIKITYQCIGNFASRSIWRDIKAKYKRDGMTLIKEGVDQFVEQFKEANEGEKVRLKVIDTSINDGVEYVSYSIYKAQNTGIYRLWCLVDVT